MGAPLIIGVTAATPPAADRSQLIATTNWVSSLSSGYRLNQVLVISASGTYTPSTGTRALWVEMVGGGAGTGGIAATAAGVYGVTSGAGGGAYAAKWVAGSIKASYSVTVGAAGTAGAAGANAGGAGGDTSFDSPAICLAKGGTAGYAGVTGTAGLFPNASAGGAASSCVGDITCDGGDGFASAVIPTGNVITGAGGGSVFGGTSCNSAGPGFFTVGKKYGGGASGSGQGPSSAAAAGAAGGAGVIRVWEFF